MDGWSDPTERTLERLYLAFRLSMLELLHIPDAFAVRAGRLLEAVHGAGCRRRRPRPEARSTCRQETSNDSARSRGTSTPREFRNLGGHDADVEVEAADVPIIRGFLEALLEFLYRGPAKLARGREDLGARLGAAGARQD